ncbi:MAG: chorismate mutase [Burkholderiaceae bacterium]|jgi:isochorismate pyruvate lyase|nr:chorismate mutase [Burkholderiales bacterium]MCZ8339853.1 chorismate mutase [Burkholderiaceae bacterium]
MSGDARAPGADGAAPGTAPSAQGDPAPGGLRRAHDDPDPDRPAVRRFADPAYVPLCATLAEVRAGIDAIDAELVALVARRAALVKDATRFKRDAAQAAAPARQAAVHARVRALAEWHADAFPGLPDVVEATWRTMVAGFVAREQALLAATVPAIAADPDPEDR